MKLEKVKPEIIKEVVEGNFPELQEDSSLQFIKGHHVVNWKK